MNEIRRWNVADNDPPLVGLGGTHAHVYIDGRDVAKGTVAFDVDEGWVEVLHVDDDGGTDLDPTDPDRVRTDVLYGAVSFCWGEEFARQQTQA